MLRSIGKTCLASAYTWTRAARLIAWPARAEAFPFIVCYHRVVENFDRSKEQTIPAMLVSTAMLERHVDWLSKRFDIISLDDLALHLRADRPFRRPPAAITFDDGYSD